MEQNFLPRNINEKFNNRCLRDEQQLYSESEKERLAAAVISTQVSSQLLFSGIATQLAKFSQAAFASIRLKLLDNKLFK